MWVGQGCACTSKNRWNGGRNRRIGPLNYGAVRCDLDSDAAGAQGRAHLRRPRVWYLHATMTLSGTKSRIFRAWTTYCPASHADPQIDPSCDEKLGFELVEPRPRTTRQLGSKTLCSWPALISSSEVAKRKLQNKHGKQDRVDVGAKQSIPAEIKLGGFNPKHNYDCQFGSCHLQK